MYRGNKTQKQGIFPSRETGLVERQSGNVRVKNNKGQSIIEFALAIPLILMLVFGVIEFGRLMFSYTLVVSAAREAARYGSAAENYQDCAGIRAAAVRIGGMAGVQEGNVNISYDDGFGGNARSCPPGSLPLGSRIIVSVQGVQYTPFVPMVNLSSVTLQTVSRRTILIGLELK